MSSTLKIVFMGTPDFAVPSLQTLLDGPNEVITVVCQPDRKKGRGRKLLPPPVKVLANENGLPVLQPESVKTDEFLETIRSLRPDLIVVVAYGKILPPALLKCSPMGAINVHGSLLPKYRGAAPIQWAVLNGEKRSGITIMQLDEGMDTGDILYTQSIAIDDTDTAGSLFAKLSDLGGKTLGDAVELLKQGKLTPVKQDHSKASYAPMLSKNLGHLDWNKTAAELHCAIRGLDPWPSAYGFLNGKRFRFFTPEIVHRKVTDQPGTIVLVEPGGILIATGKEHLRIREIQPEGKKRMSVQACLCGMTITPGDIFS